MKRFFTVLLSVLVFALGFSPAVLAAELNKTETTSGVCGNSLTWTFNDSVLTISGTGEMTDFTPSQTPFLALDYSILIVEEGVTGIGDNAFSEQGAETPKLRYVSLPSSLRRIGDGAFFGCAGLERVTIPKNVENIGVGAFAFCTSLSGITVEQGNSHYCSTSGVLFKGAPTDWIDFVKYELVLWPAKCNPGHLSILNGADLQLRAISAYAYSGCRDLTSINIPTGVETIGAHAFSGCSNAVLIDVPYSVKSIGEAAFENCTALQYVSIPKSVTHIPEDAFSNCTSLARVDISKRLEKVDVRAFSGCSGLQEVYYSGTRAQWDALPIGMGNDALKTAQIHCNSCVVTVTGDYWSYTPTGGGIYTVGDTVTLTAPVSEYVYWSGWFIDGEMISTSKTYTFTVEDHVYAEAVPDIRIPQTSGWCVMVSVQVESEYGSIASGGGRYDGGDSVTLTAQATGKEVFDGWYDGDTLLCKEPIYTFWVEERDKDITVRAVFTHDALKEIRVADFMKLRSGGGFALDPQTDYSDPESLRYIYVSSDTRVATVDDFGYVVAHKAGTAKITVIAIDEYGNIARASCTVRVTYKWCQWLTIIFLFGWIWR